MALPDEDLGPTWLRDWQHIEVDLQKMIDVAASLQKDLNANYVPHAQLVFDDMSTDTPTPRFAELSSALNLHRDVLVLTTGTLAEHAAGVQAFVQAATTITKKYGEADAFSAARVSDVEAALPTPPPTLPATGQPTTGEV